MRGGDPLSSQSSMLPGFSEILRPSRTGPVTAVQSQRTLVPAGDPESSRSTLKLD